ncbi:MAG: TldD/PmbA family protein [Lachnospiraceae bacterium]|jgi:TldD protein
MKAPYSSWLTGLEPALRRLYAALRPDFDYVSFLSTDSVGFTIQISQRARSVSDRNLTTERGTVVRVRKGGLYSEAAFNDLTDQNVDEVAARIREELSAQMEILRQTGTEVYETGAVPDEPAEVFAEMETEQLPETADTAALVSQFTEISSRTAAAVEGALDCSIRAQSTHISKLFFTENRYLRQSYVYSEERVTILLRTEAGTRFGTDGHSGQCGPELFAQTEKIAETAARNAEAMRRAGTVEPGEYEVITTPGVSGIIAHEAFGHGVEMDMFVKNRALGKNYIGKRVASDLVTMHEGALCAKNVTSYAFDDEGTLAQDTVEIDHGILKTGICDALSAVRLGTAPTGNGKRQNFEHKVYTRMTNTVFEPGHDTLEEMIASIRHGYLLDMPQSGMEDPKHWGIQCIIALGYEIRDGKLTGKTVTPMVLTGYVPDLLGDISMATGETEVDGCGYCGKGYKEWVKVADGGPYLKTKVRLG